MSCIKRTVCGLGIVAVTLLISPARADASSILVGSLAPGPDNENCIPFGCPGFFSIGTYQQVYASSAFGGPVVISGLTFFNTFSNFPLEGNGITPGTYTVSLSTTSAAVGALSTTFASNVGPDSQLFFSGYLGGSFAGTSFTLWGTPFLYDPAVGNLLMNVFVVPDGPDPITGWLFVNANELPVSGPGSPLFSRMFPASSDSANGFDVGVVTQFEVTAVPEPGTLLLLGLGLVVARRFAKRA